MKNKTVLSGMQATGNLHIGHYLGVISNFVELQKRYDCYYMVANWHSLTAFYSNYEEANSYIAPMVSDWLAAGIDPQKSVVFLQSMVPAHAELSLILNMFTPVSWLQRNPTYKEKKLNVSIDIDNAGFLTYPVLQAADILLYKANLVPIGEDQLPHLEMTREIARRFNNFYKKKRGFVIPEALLSNYPKVLGTDGRKMSKSYHNTLNLNDSIADLQKKIKRMKTDEKRVKRDDPGNPDNCPVYSYYDFFKLQDKEKIATSCRDASIGCVDCKKNITEAIVKNLEPFREKRAQIEAKPKIVEEILVEGSKKAQLIASNTLGEIKESMGFSSYSR